MPRHAAPATGYGIAGVAVLTAAVLSQAVRPVTHAPEAPLFVAAVILSSWLGGLGPGLVATGLSVVTLDVVMSATRHWFAIDQDVLARVGVFLVVAVFSSALDAARRRAAAERSRAFERERAARADAEAANRAKDEFVSMVAHELRTPLTAVTGWAAALGGGRLDPREQARAVESIRRNLALQARIIEDIVELSRLAHGGVSLQLAAVDLRDVIAAAADATTPTAVARGITLQLSPAADCPSVWGDAARLQQVVANLLVNAIKHSPRGGKVRVDLERVGDQARIEVSDAGCGIVPELLPHVFERYRQGKNAVAGSGLGLGLAIVRELVELHHGRVEASSPGLGEGARFTVLLPAEGPS